MSCPYVPATSAHSNRMSGTQEPSASNLDHRIERLDEGAARMIRYHSGTTLNTRISLLEALEEHYRHSPNEPVIKIHRKPSKTGRKGAMNNVECGFCPQSGKFQRIADHVVCEHFKLTLWYCGLHSCSVSVSRKSDLDRHLLAVHDVARPKKAKAERRSQASSPDGFPSSPPTLTLSGPKRTNRSRSRSMGPPSYSPGDIVVWPGGNVLREGIQHYSTPSHQEARGRPNTGLPLIFDGGVYPTPVHSGTALPTDRVFYPTHSRNSSYGLGIGTFSDAIRLSEQKAARTLPPSTLNRQVGPCHVFDRYSSSDFLSPSPRTSAASSSGIGLLPLPEPVHRVTTPIQSKSVQLGMYHAPNLSEGMHLPLPPSSPHYASIRESSQGPMASYPMTLSPQYYPPRAQINMPNAAATGSLPAGHWRPGLNTPPSRSHTPYPVDEEFAFNFGVTDALFGPRQ